MDKKSIYYDFSNFNRSYHVEKKFITRNGLTSIIEEYFFLKKNITDIDDFDCTILLIFKDSNFLQAHLINYLKTNHKINTVLLEEGLSLYRDDEIASKSIVFKFKYIIRRMILKKLKVENATIGFGYNKQVDAIAAYYPNEINNKKKKEKIMVTLPHNPPSTEVFKILNKSFGIDSNIKCEKNKVIFLGQPLSEMNICTEDVERRFFERLNDLAEKKNFYIIIKPHPKENIIKYKGFHNFILTTNKFVPAELIINIYKPILLLTWYSSAGINAQTWWGTDTLYLYKLIGLNIENKGLQNNAPISSFDDLEEKLINYLNKKIDYYSFGESSNFKAYDELILKLINI